MLMPLAFAGSAGSLLMLTGSPVNVIVSEAAAGRGAGAFPFFSFAVVGIPLLAGHLRHLRPPGSSPASPHRPHDLPPDLGRHAATLEQH